MKDSRRNSKDAGSIKEELDDLGVDVFEPETKKETTMAEALDAFSSFVLDDEKERCQSIMDKHLGDTVGELQGGTDEYEIYRISITDDDDDAGSGGGGCRTAAHELLHAFHESWLGKRYASTLTVDKLKQYMLRMCERRSQTREGDAVRYTKLGNLMFILAFGPTCGQVRHIDSMIPNVQICLYMSAECPSTTVYSLEGPLITNATELMEYWEDTGKDIPRLVKDILIDNANTKLSEKWYTKYFSFWDTIDATLKVFGKLYQPVSSQLSLLADPGTTLIAGGNEVHSGPPTVRPRMFAFAIGIPDRASTVDLNSTENEDNNGEIQYNPVLLHADLTCILVSMMELEYADRHEEHHGAKVFLVAMLIAIMKEFTQETYVRLLSDDRSSLRDWLGRIVHSVDDQDALTAMLYEAIESESILFTPDIQNSHRKTMKRKTRTRGAVRHTT